ncbi:MAG: phage tail protein [Cytophagaceae bacterium]|nr:MAG: phage tail protein [Cytophagaceae bacterium]
MDPFVGEIRLMAITFAPRGWAACQGQTMSIAQNTALFSLLGTQYGGDGRTTFGLPNLSGRTYVGAGQGAGLSPYPQGAATGTEGVTLTLDQMPAHTHTLTPTTLPVNTGTGGQSTPVGGYYAQAPGSTPYSLDGGGNMAPDVLTGMATPIGNGQAHENRMPFLTLQYCIATQGIFPQRQ